MRLVIRRSQAAVKGLMGGHKGVAFTLAYQLKLTREELELVQEYKLENYPLTFGTFEGRSVPDDTILNMLRGRSQTVNDVTTLIRNEEVIKNACDALPPLFRIVRSFGGEEVIEYPRDAPASAD